VAHEYECFVRNFSDLQEGATVVLTLRSLSPGRRKYNARVVRARVSRVAEAGRDILWARCMVGAKDPQPWSVQIVDELGPTVPGQPYSDIFDAVERLAPDARARD